MTKDGVRRNTLPYVADFHSGQAASCAPRARLLIDDSVPEGVAALPTSAALAALELWEPPGGTAICTR